jgi:hypothetical protein
MAWIESHQTLREHPKLLRLSRLLDIHRTSAAGLLHFLWWWALDHAEDGDITDYDPVDIALAAGWEGDPDVLMRALVDCGPGGKDGFIAVEGERLVLHDWWDYAGKLVDRRVKDRERKKAQREAPVTSPVSRPQEFQRTSAGSLTVQNSTQPNQKHKEEKSRASRLPEGWKPKPEPELVEAIGGQKAAAEQFARFCDYWRSQPGAKGCKVDWQATWRNWLRRSQDFKPAGLQVSVLRREELFGSDEWERKRQERVERLAMLTGETA